MYVDPILNLTLLIALSVVSGFLIQRWPGLQLVGDLTRQLQGTLHLGSGAAFSLGFTPRKLLPGTNQSGRRQSPPPAPAL